MRHAITFCHGGSDAFSFLLRKGVDWLMRDSSIVGGECLVCGSVSQLPHIKKTQHGSAHRDCQCCVPEVGGEWGPVCPSSSPPPHRRAVDQWTRAGDLRLRGALLQPQPAAAQCQDAGVPRALLRPGRRPLRAAPAGGPPGAPRCLRPRHRGPRAAGLTVGWRCGPVDTSGGVSGHHRARALGRRR